ncbi:MAG: Gfo/Idh/MocA family oxidoreductase [Verrucomicrobia bacterium]|nr:Gfo/Idh/MocA family oxidoreductase [Verrucomicrobiota bacterium]
MTDKVRIGFIGSGYIAGAHAERLTKVPGAALAAFSDVQEERAKQLAQKHNGRAYARFEEMLDQEPLDAVLLCTPHHTRRTPIQAVAAKGLALFCEKPPAFTIEDARACIETIEKAGILNTVGLMYRWADITDRVREWLDGRKVSVCQITGCWSVIYWVKPDSPSQWLLRQDQSGGPMMEQGIHLLDAARRMLDDDVIEAHAFGGNPIEPKSANLTIHDTVLANLRFAKGTLGAHVHSWSHKGWIFQIRFVGHDFELLWDIANNRMTGKVRGVDVSYQAKDDPYEAELAGFVKAVAARDQSLLRCTYADACKSFAATLAAVQSALTGTVQKVML